MTRVSKVHHSRVAGADNIAFFFATALAELHQQYVHFSECSKDIFHALYFSYNCLECVSFISEFSDLCSICHI